MIIHCLGCLSKGLKPDSTRPPWRDGTRVVKDSCMRCRYLESKPIQVVRVKKTIREVLLPHVTVTVDRVLIHHLCFNELKPSGRVAKR